MLLNMREGTHVLVMAQSRTRPRTFNKYYTLLIEPHKQANVEWTESLFLAQLQKLVTAMKDKSFVERKDVYKILYGKTLQDNYLYHLNIRSAIASGKINPKNEYRNESDAVGPLGSLSELASNNENIFEKKLSSILNGTSSLWFWDTPLPFVMASINDCENIFLHDPITVKLIPFLLRFDPGKLHHIDSLRKIKADQSMFLAHKGRESLHDFEKDVNQNDVSIFESNESFYFLHSTELLASIFPSEVSVDRRNSSARSADAYFDHFAAAYSLPDLNCLDVLHAGTATERLQVAQILNLICNKYLKLSRTYCCV